MTVPNIQRDESLTLPAISVVICTYNRAELLTGALQSLCEQTLDSSHYEIIVVDNNSSDHTHAIVEGFCNRYPNVRYYFEEQQGLSHARNRGWRVAQGEYVAFMDDDARADRDWLKLVLDCFGRVDPPPFVVGGPILPFYNIPKPAWFKDEFETRTWGDEPRFLNKGESFSGSNMILRRRILEEYDGFDVRVGMKGQYVSAGEEVNLFEKIQQCNDDTRVLYYLPQLIVFHLVPNYKMTIWYPLKRAFAIGQAWHLWHLQHRPKSLRNRLGLLVAILDSVARLCCSALTCRKRYDTYQSWIVKSFPEIAFEVGRLVGCLGFVIPVRSES